MDKRIVHHVFEQTAAHFPENIAVEHAGCRLDYARLNQEAETLAQVLRSNPVDPQVPVGIFMPSGLDYLISILGIAKAGGIFMPLAVDFPRQRLITILMHTQPQVILTDIDHVDLLKQLCTGSFPDATIRVVSFREEAPLAVFSPDHIPGMPIQAGGVTHRPTDPHIADPSTADSPVYRPGPDDGLYVMHTSGSTGIPKAILGSHKGLSHFVHWEIREFGLTPDLRVSLLAPPTFDVSLRDIFVPLMVGGTVCIPDPETRNHSNRLLDWLGQAGITLMHCTPSVFRLLMAELEMRHSANPLPALQRILLAGEPLYGEDVNRWQSIMGNRVELVNLYGPTETTLAKLYHRIAFQTYDREQIIPLGLPISNTAVLILKDNRLCTIGEKGDIYIKTPFRTKGYYLDSELTAQRFVQNPLNPDAEDIIYRTGDQGRYRPDRSVEFIGREDDQIKRHGIRVEPAEIEKALRSHAAVAETLIATRAGRGDHRDILLLAYFTEKQPVSPSELRAHLQDLLPEYMIPDFFIAMDAFPRNAHGKTDRSALPLPAAIPCGSLPDTDTEIRLAAIWQEVLGTPVVGKTDSFFDVGGNSLNAMRILARIYHEMGREITLKSFFTHPRLQDLASLIDGSPSITYQPIERVPETPEQTNFWPLSAAQHRLWVLHQMQGGETVYNIPIAYACRGPFDPDRWAHALESMVCRHEAFRTCFILQSDQPRQQILPSVSVPVEVVDLSAAPDPLAACKNRVQSLASTLFDLTQAPLLRAAVYKIGCEHHVLALVVHHIISDAWSMDILARETAVFYAASPHIPDMPPLPCRYPDYTLWQKRLLNSPKMKAQSDYWRRQLAGDPSALDLPIDFIRPAVQTFTGGAVEFTLNEALTEKLSDLGKNHQASLFMVVQTLIKILLFRYSGQVELRIGAPVSGRIHPDISGLIGCFVNMLVLRDTIQPHQSASDLLNQVRHTTTEALAHQDYPFDQLVNELVLDRDISRNPLVDVGLTFYEADPVITSGKELVLTPFAFDWPVSKMDLIFTFRPAGKTLQGEARFRSDLFQPDTIHRMIAHLKILIHSVRENPATPIADLTILPDSEKKLILDEFVSEKRGQVSGNREQEPTLPPLFIQIDQIAGQSPDKPAVVCEDRSIGYRELNRMSDDLARYLRRRGVDAGMPVAVLLHRSPSWVMAMIGVMKAGGVYLPIDPQYPESRIQFMLEDSGCRLLITDTSLWAFSSAFDTLQRVNLDAGLDAELDAGLDDGCFASSDVGIIPEIMPDQTAYMIYTSGSTGVPKGVMVPHRGPVNMAMDQIRRFGIRESDRLLQFSSPGFDASIYEMYLTFFSGATLVIVPPADIQDPERFIRYLADQQVTLATLPPVYLGTLNRALPECVHTVITAGEAAMASDAVYYGSRIQYINAYGPTETSVCAACHRVSPDHSYPLGIPIGRPLSGLRIFILDSRLQPVPIGIPGEICISGIGLAHGYHNRPELTEQAFVPHPFEPGNRLYRSGDVGKWLPDGDILFLGRKDDQVKIRGHRIEIQEIVLMLRHQPGIRDAVVFSHPNPGGRELTAYCIPETRTDNDGLAESALKQALGRQLPAFMVPSRIVFLERFPLTANGKIDRRALPDPMQEAVCSDVQPPLEGMAGLLTQIWCHVLGREAVGLHDNFFALGGDSIKAIQVSARLHENHLHLQVADLYRFPTIDELLGHIQAANPDNTSGPAWGQTPLTPIQRWFFENFADHCHHFNQAVLLEPALPLNPAILKIALRSVIDHHDALRSRFSRNTDGWVQTIDPPGMEMEVEVVVLDGSRQSDAADLIRNHAAEVQAGFDISRPPLIRVVWYRLADRERLLIICHHLVVDTVSWRILLEDLEAAYRSGLQGQSAVLPAKTIGMKQWAESLQAYASDPNLTADIPFWKSQLSDSGNQPRSLCHTCRDVQTARFHLSDFETEALLNQGQRVYQASAQELLLAGLATAFRHWQGYNRLCLAMEHHGREVGIMPAEPLRTVGWFTSLYPVIFPVETEPGAQIRSIQRHLHEIPGQGLGFGVLRYSGTDKIREELNTGNWPAISFNYLGRLEPATPQSFFREVPEPVGPLVAPDAVRLHDLDIQAWIYQNTLHASIYFHPDQISEDRVQSLLNFYRQALTDMSLHCTDRSPDVLSTDSRFYGLSDLDLEKALGDD